MELTIDQGVHAISLCETFSDIALMLSDALRNIACHAGIKGAIALTGQDIYCGLSVLHSRFLDSRLRGNDGEKGE